MDAEPSWMTGGTAFILSFRPEVNGYAAVDVVAKPWPDGMGDPKDDFMLFGAWTMGHFGPFTFPGGLKRAAENAWHWDRDQARAVVDRHAAFVRIQLSYAFGAGDDQPILPADYDPVPELHFLTRVAQALSDLPGALLYYNPNGEVLAERSHVAAFLASAAKLQVLPLELWCNVRMFAFDERWKLMDTVGNNQLDLPDLEACFDVTRFDPGEVGAFLRNATWYVHTAKATIRNGDTMDGPGGVRWTACTYEEPVSAPPREVIAWTAQGGGTPPAPFTARKTVAPAPAKPWWKFWE